MTLQSVLFSVCLTKAQLRIYRREALGGSNIDAAAAIGITVRHHNGALSLFPQLNATTRRSRGARRRRCVLGCTYRSRSGDIGEPIGETGRDQVGEREWGGGEDDAICGRCATKHDDQRLASDVARHHMRASPLAPLGRASSEACFITDRLTDCMATMSCDGVRDTIYATLWGPPTKPSVSH